MSNTFSAVFRLFQTELDRRHDKHERLVKLSRDITVASKRIIFSLHRVNRYVQSTVLVRLKIQPPYVSERKLLKWLESTAARNY